NAYTKVSKKGIPVVISVPSGNFGNLTAGLMAKKMGLPIHTFIAATNSNDVFPEYLKTKVFKPRNSSQTISNAMDVGNPSNFPRILELYKSDFVNLSQDIKGYSFNDEETRNAMRIVYDRTGYIMDPHGAVGYLGLKEFLKSNSNYSGIFLETAHPAKFKEVVDATIKHAVDLPERLKEFMAGDKKTSKVSSSFLEFKSLLPTLLS
ncbi:MAG TPA: pyridoxal-phosphate dependent enzyme, partial [Cyclobacteriaceae bacterium]|nr:pyridoxal-phosphate dependent enzyme [Cyclobacteriaceae bacterium]